jgi:hypothetical protein
MKVLYIDESGDHNLAAIDPEYPVFVLGGAIIDSKLAARELSERLAALKVRLFGRDDLILHTADICRNRNGFERLSDPSFRHRFYEEVNAVMESLDYLVLACAIRKDHYVAAHGPGADDPYALCLHTLVERFCAHVGDAEGGGLIVAESRGRVLDMSIEVAWRRLQTSSSGHLEGTDIRRRVKALVIRPKNRNIAGLKLADLVVAPIAQHVLGRECHEDYRIVERKLLRNPEGAGGDGGLMLLPKEEGQDPLRSS